MIIAAICTCHASAVQFPIGDLTADGRVNINDLLVLADEWMQESGGSADIDGLAGVDLGDFQLMGQNWQIYRPTLAINEFMAKNDSFILDNQDQYDDWIEIFNYGSAPVNIGGMHLADDLDNPSFWSVPITNTELTTIQPGGFLLIWADEDTSPDYPLHADFKLSADGEDIGLYDAYYNLIDSVTFGPQNADESFGRYPDADDNWQVFADGSATPGTSNAPGIVQQNIIITEIMYHPYHNSDAYEPENIFAEYIELYNPGPLSVNLTGWRFADGVDFNFPNITINAHEYLVVAADPNTFEVLYPSVSMVIGPWTGKLQNRSETITLINQQGGIVDTVTYADEGEWSQRYLGPIDHYHRGWLWSNAHDGEGKSLELVNPSVPNQYGQNWAASTVDSGTPGAANSVAVADTAPLILNAEHCPVIPGSADTVTVTARIIDELESGVTASVYYRVDASSYTNENNYPTYDAQSYSTLTMYDDGLHNDGQAGDDIYGAQIPAHPDGTIIELFIQALDTSAKTRTWPASSDMSNIGEGLQQVTNLLYQIDDSFDPDAQWTPGDKPIFYFVMTEAERARLADIGDVSDYEAYSEAQMNGTFISIDGVDTKIRYNVGFRNRGEGTRGVPPNNYRVNFRHDDPWKNITAININSKYTYLQVAGSAIFQMAGLLAANAKPVQVRVNGSNLALMDPSRMYGYYAYLEVYDGDWCESHVPDDGNGNIYKAAYASGWNADLTYLGTDPADYEYAGYFKLTNEAENDWTDLYDLTWVLDNEPDATYVEEVNRILYVEQWLRWFALNTIVGNNENGLATGVGDDYRMYRPMEDPRFQLLIHDLDTILHVAHEEPPIDRSIFYVADRGAMPLLDQFIKHPAFVSLYYNQLIDLIETVCAPENFDPLIEQVLGGWVPDSMVDEIKQKMTERITNVLQQIPQQLTIETDLAAYDRNRSNHHGRILQNHR
jgi:hypothetical protein